MADKEERTENVEGTENVSRGNEWEVVSLTASAYEAAPGPDQVELTDDEIKGGDTGTSDAMIMSRHFVFPPSQHENLPLEPKNEEIRHQYKSEDAGPESIEEFGGKSDTKSTGILDINVSDVYHGIPIFDEKGNILSDSGTEFGGGASLQGFNLEEKEHNFDDGAKVSSLKKESSTTEESTVIPEATESSDQSLDSGISNIPQQKNEDRSNEPNLPCEAWWKKQAASVYTHAKEANAFWSIFIAAAVMGLVILGQSWQQERWRVLQHKWQFSINDEMMSRMLRPLSRFKDVFVGGSRRGSVIRGSSSMEP